MNGLDQLYASRPLQALPVSPGEVLMVDHRSGERHVLTPEVVDALDHCDTWDSLQGHRERLLERLPELRERAQAVSPVLQGLAQRGLLERADQCLARLPRSAPQASLAPLTLLLAPGESLRPDESSAAVLNGLAQSCGGLRLVCEHAADAQPWSQALESSGLPVEICEQSQRQAWLTALADDDAAADGLCLLGGAGAEHWRARQANYALLRAAGQRLLLLEADQLGMPLAVAGVRQGLDPGAAAVREAWFDAAGASELGASAWDSALDWCGRALGDLLGEGGPFGLAGDDLVGQPREVLARLADGQRLKALIFGSAGVIDSPHNRWIYTLGSDSRERLWRSDYVQARQGRGLLHGMQQARLLGGLPFAPSLQWVDPACGFDGPLAANGHLWRGAYSQLLDPSGRQLHLPWCLPRADRSATDRVAVGQQAYWPDLNRLLADWALAELPRCQAASVVDRAAWWAAQLRDLAAASPAMLSERLAVYSRQAQAQLIAALQYQLESAESVPTVWRDDIVAIIEAQGRVLLGSESARLDGYADEPAVTRLATELRQMADCSEAWPGWLARAAEHPG